LRMQRESLGIESRPPEADAGSWEQYQHIKSQRLV
jgi:hypothetical protein